jgi:hypothetical protein
MVCAALLVPGDVPLMALEQEQQPAAPEAGAPKLKSPEQLDSLVAPLALYPDPLLAQVLAAATYPLEIVQAARWLKENSKLTGENLTKAAAKQPWDPSVQALVAFPDALNFLDKNVQWAQELGNAFLDQQGDVMDAIQRMRKKAKDSGNLKSSKEQKVEVKTVESKQVIVIEPADPQVIYVPSVNPTVVYGAAPVAYAYPPVAYPYGAMAATAAVSFGVGVAMGAFWGGCCGGGGWGWNAGWSNNNITINNNFNNRYGYKNTNVGSGNVGSGNRGGNSWQHNPSHRGAVPYANQNTAQRFKGTSRDQSGRTQRFDDRGSQSRDRGGNRGDSNRLDGNRSDGNRGDANRGRDNSGRDAGNRGQSNARSGGGDRIGNRSVDSGSRSNNSALGGGSRERSQAASDRGFSSSRSSGAGGGGGARASGGGARASSGSRGGGRRR